MASVLAPNFSLPALSVAPTGRGPSAESVRAAKEELRLLLVDGSSLTPAERTSLWPRGSEMREWYVQASSHGVALVVLRNGEHIELYSTRQDGQLACSPPLLALAQRGHRAQELSRVRVIPQRGMDAAHHLFRLAAGIGITPREARVVLSRIETASTLAAQAGCLSPTLDSLFQIALRVGDRVKHEALEGRQKTTPSLREVAEIGAARIVEEEILNWKTEQSKLFRSLALMESTVLNHWTNPPAATDSAFPGAEEAPSGTRIRVADKLQLTSLSLAPGLAATMDRDSR